MSAEFKSELASLVQGGDAAAALALCEKRVLEVPEDAQARWQLGRLYAATGRADDAVRALQDAHTRQPDSVQICHDLARALSAAGRRDDALRAARDALTIDGRYAPAHNHLGQLLGNGGDLAAAIAAFEQALAIDERFAPALENLANALDHARQPERAAALWLQLARLRPADPRVQRRCGARFQMAGDYVSALECFARWTGLQPADADAAISEGSAAQMLGRHDHAGRCYRRALDIDPARADAWSNIGTLYQAARDLPAARESYERAVAIDARNADAAAGLAALLEMEGRYDDALAYLAPFEEKIRHNAELCIVLARLLRRAGDYAHSEQVLTRLLDRESLANSDVSRLNFMLADTLAAQDRHDDAFAHYRLANERKQVSFDSAGHRRFAQRICTAFDAACLAAAPVVAPAAPRMVFVLGMPRSGTTLIEQMLSCHSEVTAAGELEFLAELVTAGAQDKGTAAEYPEAWAAADAATLAALAEHYRRRVRAKVGDAAIVTDKMPGNFLYLGLIQILFPDAQIIHCRRNALDTAVSLYCRDFARGALPFAYDLATIGNYYRDYRMLMEHWRDVLSLPLLEVDYETVVADTESQCRRVIDFLGLPWQPECLEFHRARRVTYTASNAQVRKPIYASAVDRHRHYSRHLGPLRDALGEYANAERPASA